MTVSDTSRHIYWSYLTLVEYEETLQLQETIREQRWQGKGGELLLLLQHPPVYTIGVRPALDNLLSPLKELKEKGIKVIRTNRGGDITFHGPGQLVAYPILSLSRFRLDIPSYVRSLEEVVIHLLEDYGLKGERVPDYPGVWVDGKKIAAVGINIKKGIAIHGFALNVNTDLDYFTNIHPCGIQGCTVTSLHVLLGYQPPLLEVMERLVDHFGEIFNGVMVEQSPRELWSTGSWKKKEQSWSYKEKQDHNEENEVFQQSGKP